MILSVIKSLRDEMLNLAGWIPHFLGVKNLGTNYIPPRFVWEIDTELTQETSKDLANEYDQIRKRIVTVPVYIHAQTVSQADALIANMITATVKLYKTAVVVKRVDWLAASKLADPFVRGVCVELFIDIQIPVYSKYIAIPAGEDLVGGDPFADYASPPTANEMVTFVASGAGDHQAVLGDAITFRHPTT